MGSFYNNKKATKTKVGTRKWNTLGTDLVFGGTQMTLGLWTRKAANDID